MGLILVTTIDVERPVGVGGANRPDDVKTVQATLNQIHYLWGGTADQQLAVDGLVGPKTIKAIKRFQKRNFAWADGLVEPGKDTIQKMNQINGGLVDIIVVEAAGVPDNGAIQESRDMWEGEMQVYSVGDMVSQTLTWLSLDPGKLIKTMTIIGHAGPGDQRIGAGNGGFDGGFPSRSLTLTNIMLEVPDPGQSASPTLWGTAADELPLLASSFAPDGLVILGGCQIARNNFTYNQSGFATGGPRTIDGQDLLRAVSAALGGNVRVEGGQIDQDSRRGIEGLCVRCNADSCVVGLGSSRFLEGPTDDFVPIPGPFGPGDFPGGNFNMA